MHFNSVCDLIDGFSLDDYGCKVAIQDQGKSLSYIELKHQSDQLAMQLLKQGITKSAVAVRMMPSVDLIVAIIGIIKAGNSYVPIPLDMPEKRVTSLYEYDGVDAEIISNTDSCLPLRGSRSFRFSTLFSDSDIYVSLPELKPDDVIYIIYTSGSTGRPKGVMVEHGNVLCFLEAMAGLVSEPRPTSGTTICSYGFDVSVWEIFSMLTHGGALHIMGDTFLSKANLFARYIREEKIQSCYIPPGLLKETINCWCESVPEDLLVVLVGVEPIRQGVLQTLRTAMPDLTIINGYGPTETTVCATAHVFGVASDVNTSVPIGKPLPGYEIYIDLPDPSRVGELVVGGGGVARGYKNNPAATDTSFFNKNGKRYYRTGDLVFRREDGEYEFKSRIDDQIKINGFRIEPGEITSAIAAYKGVKGVVILPINLEGHSFIAAFIESDDDLHISALRKYLFSVLPRAMVPLFIKIMKVFPITNRGKIDRCLLSEIAINASVCEENFESNQMTEEIIEVLQSELECQITATDNFFLIGGSSLAAIRIAAMCSDKFNRVISADSLFRFPVIGEFTNYVASIPDDRCMSVLIADADENIASRAEQDLWIFFQVAAPEAMTERVCISIKGACDIENIRASTKCIIERHHLLRSVMYFDEQLCQIRKITKPQCRVGFNEYTADHNKQSIDQMICEMGYHVHDPLQPGIALSIITQEPNLHTLVFSISHLFFDGLSARILFYELLGRAGANTGISDEIIKSRTLRPIHDLVLTEQQKEFYSQCNFFALPYDRPIETKRSYRGSSIHSYLSSRKIRYIKWIAEKHTVTEYATILALFLAFLDRYRQSDLFGVSVPVSTRRTVVDQGSIGCFVTLVPMLLQHDDTKNIENIVHDVASQLWSALLENTVTHGDVAKVFHDKSYQTCTPLNQIVFAEDVASYLTYKTDEAEFSSFRPVSVTSKFDITLFVGIQSDMITLSYEYSSDLFSKDTILLFKRDFEEFIDVFSTNEVTLGDVDWFSKSDKALLRSVNDTFRHYPDKSSLIDLFERQASTTPENIAITSGDINVSYRELKSYTDYIAGRLSEVVQESGTAVMVLMADSITQIVALLGVLKLGSFYVPVDVSTPAERLAIMINELQPKCLLLDPDMYVLLCNNKDLLSNDLSFVVLDKYSSQDSIGYELFPSRSVSASSPAYAMFTSGTSGTPKCVLIPHKAVSRLVLNNSFAELNSNDSFARIANFGFDGATFEIWGALLNGGRLVLVDKEIKSDPNLLCSFLQANRISAGFFTVTLFSRLIDSDPEKLSGIRHLIVGGEQVPTELFRKAAHFVSIEHLVNGYGPTENTTFSCCHRLQHRDFERASIPIGTSISNSSTFVVDVNNRPVARGVKGEILVGGDGLAIGYLNDTLLTRQRFVDVNNYWLKGRFYKTGDYGRYNKYGEIEYIGRKDRQVKIRGFRVELQDVEYALAQFVKGARVAATVVQGVAGKEIYAFVEKGISITTVELHKKARAALPSHMVPARLVIVDIFPMTGNGKIDIDALVEQEKRTLATMPVQDDVTFMLGHQALLSIWRQVLGVNNITTSDNFFEVGGNSLSMVMVKEHIKQNLQVDIPMAIMFEYPTVNSLAEYIELLKRGSIYESDISKHDQFSRKSSQRKSRIAQLRQRNNQ